MSGVQAGEYRVEWRGAGDNTEGDLLMGRGGRTADGRKGPEDVIELALRCDGMLVLCAGTGKKEAGSGARGERGGWVDSSALKRRRKRGGTGAEAEWYVCKRAPDTDTDSNLLQGGIKIGREISTRRT